jgi:hypothetical protein
MSRVAAPAERKIAKTHDASWACVSPPRDPTARVTAIGPEAENASPTTPFEA